MTVKRFVAPDMRRALELVRHEMGPDAIILSSQRTAKGVEIITSLDTDEPTRGVNERREFGSRFDEELDQPLASDQAWQTQQGIKEAAQRYRPAVKPADNSRSEQLAREIEAARERMIAAKSQPRQNRESDHDQRATKPSQARASTADLGDDYFSDTSSSAQPRVQKGGTGEYALDRQMAGLAEQVQRHTGLASNNEEEDRRLRELKSEIADMRLLLEQQMYRMREHSGVAPHPGQSLSAEALQNHLTRLGLPSGLVKKLTMCATPGKHLSTAWKDALAHLSRQIPVVADGVDQGGVFAFVGPTGVGKTTTIAKLAARYVLKHGLGKVALITTDTYRVGAHDQLRALGRILSVPVRVVDQERDLTSVVASLKNFPLILVDTAGFRQGDPLLREQEAMLEACPGIQRVLVLSCNSQLQTLKASAHAYHSGRVRGCVLTKLDESASLGEAIGVVMQQNLPVMYTSSGQGIPKDIAVATGHSLVARAVKLAKAQSSDQRHSAVQ